MTDARSLPLSAAIERIRKAHSLNHVPTSVMGYCGETDGISAVYCETGILLDVARDSTSDMPPVLDFDLEQLPSWVNHFNDGTWATVVRLDDAQRIVADLERRFAEAMEKDSVEESLP